MVTLRARAHARRASEPAGASNFHPIYAFRRFLEFMNCDLD
jgi:hypothetical protein